MTTRASMRRWVWHPIGLIFILATFFGGCSGKGCSCLSPIPGGFPSAERTKNAAQLRVSSTGIAAATKDPAALVSALVPGGLSFNVPSSCGSSTPVCCPGGTAQSPCGPIVIDLSLHPGDKPRLEVKPAQGASRIDVTVRARVKTQMDVPVQVPVIGNCGLAIDTSPGPTPDIQIDAPVNLTQDATAGTTRIEAGTPTVSNLTTDDVKLNGSIGCSIANLGLGLFLGTVTSTFQDAIKNAINNQTCKKCPGGTKDECGPLATACTNNVCEEGSQCLEELGVTGRLAGASVFSFSPGTTGAIDLYEVAGNYATTDSGGVSLGLLGGMLPAGAPRDRCGPPATAPAPVTIPESTYFQGNTRPDTNAPFDIAIGVHQNQLDRFAYSAYDGGLLCLTIGTGTVSLLNSDTFGLFLRSLPNLTSNETVPMAIGLRPQSPPTITLGKNTFVPDGNGGQKVDMPLLDVKFKALELDIFAEVEGQYVRLFTLVADLDLPVGLSVEADGSLAPVLGDLTNAFSNISVKNAGPMIETPAELANVFPMLLQLALPQLAGGLGKFSIPTLAGLKISVTDITSVDNDAFLAIFGNLAPASMMAPAPRVETTAIATRVEVPSTAVFADARAWTPARRPRVELELGGSEPELEWSTRVDDGLWSPWSHEPVQVVSSDLFWLQGLHTLEVRARVPGEPLTADLSPVVLPVRIDTMPPVATLERVDDDVMITGRDLVSKDAVTVRWRFAGGAWKEAPSPVEVALAGHPAVDLEVEVVDEAGNRAPARGSTATEVIAFHGQPGTGGGCACNSGGGGGAGAGLAALIVLVALIGPRRRRRIVAGLGVLVLGGSLEACSCSHNACGGKACMAGEVTRGAIGRWNSIASDGKRTVATTYDQTLGDLVLVELKAGAEPTYTVIDGVPAGVPPVYDPGTYRGGVPDPGPDVGAWSSVALVGGKVQVVYQDRDRKALKYAVETASGGFTATDVDVPMDTEELGAYASLAVGSDGRPAVAYVATALAAADGTRTTDLRLARAQSANPSGATSWTVSTVASAPRTCAGLCGSDKCVKSATAGKPETCATPTTDCTPACGSGSVCVTGACLKEDTNEIVPLVGGTGLFANLRVLPDGRLAIIFYDDVRTALVAQLETAAGAGTFAETVLDGADGADRGQFASAVVDTAGTIHVAYQDAQGDQLFYTTLTGTTASPPELVDDGTRTGDRTHGVGAGAMIWLDGGSTPRIAYQDGLTADLVTATRGGGGWTHQDLATGDVMDGFHIAAPPTGGWLVWDGIDKTQSPASTLQVKQAP